MLLTFPAEGRGITGVPAATAAALCSLRAASTQPVGRMRAGACRFANMAARTMASTPMGVVYERQCVPYLACPACLQDESALAEYAQLGEDFEGVVQQYADTKVRCTAAAGKRGGWRALMGYWPSLLIGASSSKGVDASPHGCRLLLA